MFLKGEVQRIFKLIPYSGNEKEPDDSYSKNLRRMNLLKVSAF